MVAEVKDVPFPKLLDPVDDLPPVTVITHARRDGDKVFVRGSTSDNGDVRKVVVNGQEARALRPGFQEWEIVLAQPQGELQLTAHAEDAAGKVEKRIDTGVRLVTAENMEEPEIHDLLHPPLEKYLK